MKSLPVYSASIFLLAAIGVACSSSDDGGSSSSSSGSIDDATNCTCEVSYNGVSKTLKCTESACVNGQPYECKASTGATQGGNGCDVASSSSSSGGSSSGGPAATTVSCPGATGAVNDACDATTQYCILATNGGDAASCVPFPAGCTDCECASDNADAAWKAANNNTANCGTPINQPAATVTCESKDGAVTVTCD